MCEQPASEKWTNSHQSLAAATGVSQPREGPQSGSLEDLSTSKDAQHISPSNQKHLRFVFSVFPLTSMANVP